MKFSVYGFDPIFVDLHCLSILLLELAAGRNNVRDVQLLASAEAERRLLEAVVRSLTPHSNSSGFSLPMVL